MAAYFTEIEAMQMERFSAVMETWITFQDLENALSDSYEMALASGHSHDSAVAKAAAFLAIHRDQVMHPAVSTGIVELVLSATTAKK